MSDEKRLALLKLDLEILTNVKDLYLSHLLKVARGEVEKEGIQLTESVSDENLVIMYAAYLYRKRAAEITTMPRMLRWALNNRLMSQKGAVADVT